MPRSQRVAVGATPQFVAALQLAAPDVRAAGAVAALETGTAAALVIDVTLADGPA